MTDGDGAESRHGSEGVVQQLRESQTDIAVVEGDGDDVFLKAGGDVLLLHRMEATTLADEIQRKVSAHD